MADRIKLIVITVVAAIILFYGLALFQPAYWNWAVYNLSSLNYLQIALLVIALITLFIQAASDAFIRQISKFSSVAAKLPKWSKICLWVILPLGLLYLLRIHVHIYGDAQNLIGSMVDVKITSPFFNRIGMLLQLLSKLLGVAGSNRDTAEIFLAIVSIIAGAFFIFYTWKTVVHFVKIINLQVTAFLTIVSSGFILIFAGYIETYAILFAWLAFYTYNLLLFTDKKISTLRFVIVFIVGVFWHVLFMTFLPSFLWALNKRYKLASKWLMRAFIILFVAAMWLAGRILKISFFKLTVPFSSNEFTLYTMFSKDHLIDFLNELLIVGPVLAIIGLIFIIISAKDDKHELFVWLTIPSLALAFMLDPLLGAVRDWDLLAIFAFPIILLAVSTVANSKNARIGYILVPILLINFVHTGSSIAVNKNQTMAVDRVVRIALEDPHYQAEYYLGSRTQEFSVILSNIFDRHDLALSFLKRKAAPGKADILALANYHFNQDEYQEACKYYDQIYGKIEMKNTYRFAYGKSLVLSKRPAEALPILYTVLEDTTFHKLNSLLGMTHMLTMSIDSAIKYFELGLVDYPDSAVALQKYALFMEAFNMPGLAAYYETRLYKVCADSADLLQHIIGNFDRAGLTDSADHYRSLMK